MSPGKEIGEHEGPPPKIDFDGRGLGYTFSVGSMIMMLLSLDDIEDRAGILAEVCKDMKINPQDVVDEYNDKPCPKCGFSLVGHRSEPDGRCP